MKNKKAIIALSLLLAVGLTAGCSQSPSPAASTPAASQNSQKDASSAASTEESKESSAPESSEESSEEEGSIPEISDPTPDNEGEIVEGVFIYNHVAYEQFYGGEEMAKNYAETLSYVAKNLGSGVKVYNVLVPTHVAVDLPAKFNDRWAPEDVYIDTVFKSFTESIVSVNAMPRILQHRNEYLYFSTDHHWTATGAYYAYLDFTKAAGVDAVKLSDLTEQKIDGYNGSLANLTGLTDLKTDSVTYYTSDKDVTCVKYDGDGTNPTETMLIHSYAEGSNAYGVFLGGDCPIMVSKNAKGNGKKIAVVKESYGNAFCPFMAYTYSEVHMIDFRYVDIDLGTYLRENGIDEVVFINNVMASATGVRCEEMRRLVKGGAEEPSEDETPSGEPFVDDEEDAAHDYEPDLSQEEAPDASDDWDDDDDDWDDDDGDDDWDDDDE